MTAAVATRPAQLRNFEAELALSSTGLWSEPPLTQAFESNWSPFTGCQYYLGCLGGTGGVLTSHLIQLVSASRTGSRVRVFVEDVASTATEPSEPVSSMVNRIRLAFGLSVTDLASVLGVERPTIYSWLRDGSTPAPARLARVRRVLGLADIWAALRTGRRAPTMKSEVAPGTDLFSALRAPHLWVTEIERNLRDQASAIRTNEARRERLLATAEDLGIPARPASDFDIATGRPLGPEF